LQKSRWQNYPKLGAVLWVGDGEADDTKLRSLALEYAKYLLSEGCERSGPLFEANNHPDFKIIEPEIDKRTIKIDWIRELIDWSLSKPQIAPIKVALLNPADAMNPQAANALLKTLEEPPTDTLFLLVTHRLSAIALTIRSRCHIIRHRAKAEDYKIIQDPIRTQVLNDLQALKKDLAEPVTIAAQWLKKDLQQVLYWLMIILFEFTNNSAQDEQLVKSRRWWRFMDEVFEARRAVENKTQVNTQLMIESLLIQYARIITTK
jgi:hypothetical protein